MADPLRNSELAKIHIAKKDLGLDDETYRDVLWTICRARTSADLDSYKRHKLITHFRSLGWKAQRSNKKRINDPKSKKIWSLWYQLKDAGKIQYPTAKALRSEVRKLTDCDDLKFCTEAQKSHVIEVLKGWLDRD